MGYAKVLTPGMFDPGTGNTYPTHEDTNGKGGFMAIANKSSISADRLKLGMFVHQTSDDKVYKLTSENPVTWEEVTFGGGGSNYTFRLQSGSNTLEVSSNGGTSYSNIYTPALTKGDDGTTFTPSVDSSGNLSWTNDGGKTNPTTVNIKGANGTKIHIGDTYHDNNDFIVSTFYSLNGTPAVGDLIIDIGDLDTPAGEILRITSISGSTYYVEDTDLNIKGDTGPSGATASVFTSSSNGLAPASSDSNITNSETYQGNVYLCGDGKYRPLPTGAFNDTKNTAGSYNSSNKLYLVGTTTLSSTGVLSYSNSSVYSENGKIHSAKIEVGNPLAYGSNSIVVGGANIYTATVTSTSNEGTVLNCSAMSSTSIASGMYAVYKNEARKIISVTVSSYSGNAGTIDLVSEFSNSIPGSTTILIYNSGAFANKSGVFGSDCIAEGVNSFAMGIGTVANQNRVLAIGLYNQNCSVGDRFVVGNGTTSTKKTVFKISDNNSSNNSANDCIVTVTGLINASSGFYESSDIRKKNILEEISLDKAYDLIDKCQTIFYNLKDDPNKNQKIGVIAQEVQQYFPELVYENSEGFLSVDYAKLSVVLMKICKNMKIKMDSFEERLLKLENKL